MSKLLKIFLAVSSLTACSTMPPPPEGQACVAFYKDGACFNTCFDMTKDFNQDGSIKAGAKSKKYQCNLAYFNKRVNFDPDSFANLKAFALKLKARCEAQK